MHDINDHFDPDNFDINLSEISKIEGAASLEIKVRDKKIEDLKFSISEWKRFYTQAIQGKPAVAIPQLVARICGTCSNAHLLCSIKAIENALSILPSNQTKLLRKLLHFGLLIRDHALHLYIFALPDIYNKNSILEFDENDTVQNQLLEDTFAVKEVGNQLSIIIGGRSVHAPNPTIGGFHKLPKIDDLKNLRPKLQQIRPKIINLVEIFAKVTSVLKPRIQPSFSSLTSDDFSFLDGIMKSAAGKALSERELDKYLEAVIIPYSHARGFKLNGNLMMVGALARLNLSKQSLHPKTKIDINNYLSLFPSSNIYHNNLAQAIEILHVIDTSLDIIDRLNEIAEEKPPKITPKESVGVGIIEAPRGTLYHKYKIDSQGLVKKAEIIVPTGQNQVLMEKGIYEQTERLLLEDADKEKITLEAEKLIRAFDPCMSCASHFLQVNWR
ncbi:nickel-dependent hydrogenase large subunit [Candidatus Roizmanbacteria bacterium]|nr:nickel-dependent hydrogenase large subunit [Candidatus Roizmanbacteria bacterium]